VPDQRSVFRICTLCEATCGIEVVIEGDTIVTIRGDAEDPFSRGYICPKAYALKGLQEDPDRLRQPVKRTAAGFVPIEWDEAFALAIGGLSRARAEHGDNAVGVYLGNPSAHSLHSMLYGPVLLKALATQQVYSASSADQLPKMVSAALMFGGGLTIPVPDLDRTDYLLVLGGNPVVSNGSLMTAPDVKKRLEAIVARGGKVVVIDPRRTETARIATEHCFIRPGTDALFLLALCNVIVGEGLDDLGAAAEHVSHLSQARDIVARYCPERVAARCGIAADVIRRIARELCAADSAACYGRIGTTCQEFGTLASWAVDLVNVLSGNLDRPGGAMFAGPAASRGANHQQPGRAQRFGRWRSRVRDFPEMFGELPVSTLADEILEPGAGQIRAMLTVAGNPVSSAPNVGRLAEAFAAVPFMVAVDFYINETTRFADVILPPPAPLERDTYDVALYHLAIRNVAKYSPPALPKPAGQPDEWEILLTLAKGLMGQAAIDLATVDDFIARALTEREIGDGGRWEGLTVDESMKASASLNGPRRLLDLMLRVGLHGDGYGRDVGGVSLATLEANPHGVDLGALQSRLPAVLGTADGTIDLAPELIVGDLERLDASLAAEVPSHVLIGRRHLRSNNSWMHNIREMVKGKPRCTLLIHPDDAGALGVASGNRLRVASRVGEVIATVETSDEIMPGVVSLPHGWGHDVEGVELSVAREHAGVNVNVLSDDRAIDTLSGNAAFNGVPVTLTAL